MTNKKKDYSNINYCIKVLIYRCNAIDDKKCKHYEPRFTDGNGELCKHSELIEFGNVLCHCKKAIEDNPEVWVE